MTGRPRSRYPVPLVYLDAEARAIAAGQRFARRILSLEDGRRHRSHVSQFARIEPRWYEEIVRARKERRANA